jgi:ATP-dependent RNA helicase SUPV3L1/SUV3
MDGDIHMLQQRLAAIRTWTYVANRQDWVADNKSWQAQTRVIEDRLSDMLHQRLMQRFIDKRTSALLKGLKQEDSMEVIVQENGEVSVGGHHVGSLKGLRFHSDPIATGLEERAVKAAAFQALRPELDARLAQIAKGGINDFVLSDTGLIIWQTEEIGRLLPRQSLLKPKAVLSGGELGSDDVRKQAASRLDAWLEEIVARDLGALVTLAKAAEGEVLQGLARGVAFRVAEAGGVMERSALQQDLQQLGPEERTALRTAGLRIGRANVYLPLLLKPRAARLHALLAYFVDGGEAGGAPFLPPLGVTSFTLTTEVSAKALAAAGFRAFGNRAVRLDIVDRIADALFDAAATAKGPCPFPPTIVSLLGASNEEAERLVQALGWEKIEVTRPVAPKPEAAEPEAVEVEAEAVAEAALVAEVAPEAEPEAPEVSVTEPEAAQPVMETISLWRRVRNKEPGRNLSAPKRPHIKGDAGPPTRNFDKKGGNRPKPQGQAPQARYSAAPPVSQAQSAPRIDPNNPFAALLALKIAPPAQPTRPPKARSKPKRAKDPSPAPTEGGDAA